MLPTAAAFEHPDRAVERARVYFEELGAPVRALPVLNRRDAEADENVRVARAASSSTSPTVPRCTSVRC